MTVHTSFLTVIVILFVPICSHLASAQCNLPCVTHGIPNEECTGCTCLGAWSGDDCSVWDENVDPSEVIAAIQDLLNKYSPPASSTAQVKRAGNPILQTALGRGVDLSTGALKMSQLIKTNYSGGDTWTNANGKTYTRTSGTTFQTFDADSASSTTQVYSSLYEFALQVYGEANLNDFKWQGPALAQESLVMMQQIFPDGAYVSVAAQRWPLFSEEFHVTPPTDQFTAFDALKSLPPDFSTERRKMIYRSTITSIGTHVIVGATYGGVMGEVSAVSESIFADYGVSAKSVIQLWAQNDLASRTGQAPPSGSYFSDIRSLQSAWAAPITTNSQSPIYDVSFQTKMQDLPQPFQFKLLDFTSFLPQPLQANVRQAFNDYLEEQFAQIENLNQCPHCERGTCDTVSKTCVCDSPNIVGTACNQCASGWFGSNCDIASCNCVHGSCSVPYECYCDDGWGGQNCDQQINPYDCEYIQECTSGTCCTTMCLLVTESSDTTCHYPTGPCDQLVTCSGYNSNCDAGYLYDDTQPCNVPSGPCGTPSYCTGESAQCKPIDISSLTGQICRDSAGPCDDVEACPGGSQFCPLNRFMQEGTPCTDPAGAKGVCTGLSPNCVPYCNVAKLILWQDPIGTGSASVPATLSWFLHDGTTYTITVTLRIAGNPDGIVGTFIKENVPPETKLRTEAIEIPITGVLTQDSSYEYLVTVQEGNNVQSTKTIVATVGATSAVKADSQPDFITCPLALSGSSQDVDSTSNYAFMLGAATLL